MSAVTGIHHVALVTRDLGRLADFYREVFGAQLQERSENDVRLGLGILRVGDAALHVFERPEEALGGIAGARGLEPFARGRLDHVSLRAPDPASFGTIRERLVARGAADGTVVDFGPLVSLFASDPDGFQIEVSLDKPAGWEPPFPLAPPRGGPPRG